MHPRKVVIIDDEPDFAEMLGEVAQGIGFDSIVFTDPQEFIQAGKRDDNDIILLDLNMPGIDGVEVMRLMAEHGCGATLILMSGYDSGVLHSASQLAEEQHLNVATSLTKPIRLAELHQLLDGFLHDDAVENRPARKVADADAEPLTVEELCAAIHEQQLILHYQPQLDMHFNSLSGVEALVRWQHPERGLVFPDKFISLAENNGLIGDLTNSVINMAAEQNLVWQKQGLLTHVSVNVSSENITSLTLPEQLTEMINDKQLDPSLIVLEVTESALMSELVTSLDILTRLRMKGFELSIDDFGTGYSSLSQLHRVPFTELKIDRSFIMKMEMDAEARAIVETCIMLGKKLGMKTVAEGVENRTIWDMLTGMGCDIAQGYYIARPMTAEHLLEWMNKRAEGGVVSLG